MAKSTQARLSAVLGKQGVSRQRKPKQNDSTGITEADVLGQKTKNGEIEVRWEDPRKLKPYLKNAMVHEPEQIKQVADSITEFGFTIPILIDEHLEILAGHARREAALQLKLPRVPCIVRRDLSDSQKMAYRIADNKIARNSEFNWQLVHDELVTLNESGYDLTLTGFRAFEIDPLLKSDWKAPGADDSDGTEFADGKHQIVLTADQYKVVLQAMAKVREVTEDDDTSDGRCVELICADYLAGA